MWSHGQQIPSRPQHRGVNTSLSHRIVVAPDGTQLLVREPRPSISSHSLDYPTSPAGGTGSSSSNRSTAATAASQIATASTQEEQLYQAQAIAAERQRRIAIIDHHRTELLFRRQTAQQHQQHLQQQLATRAAFLKAEHEALHQQPPIGDRFIGMTTRREGGGIPVSTAIGRIDPTCISSGQQQQQQQHARFFVNHASSTATAGSTVADSFLAASKQREEHLWEQTRQIPATSSPPPTTTKTTTTITEFDEDRLKDNNSSKKKRRTRKPSKKQPRSNTTSIMKNTKESSQPSLLSTTKTKTKTTKTGLSSPSKSFVSASSLSALNEDSSMDPQLRELAERQAKVLYMKIQNGLIQPKEDDDKEENENKTTMTTPPSTATTTASPNNNPKTKRNKTNPNTKVITSSSSPSSEKPSQKRKMDWPPVLASMLPHLDSLGKDNVVGDDDDDGDDGNHEEKLPTFDDHDELKLPPLEDKPLLLNKKHNGTKFSSPFIAIHDQEEEEEADVHVHVDEYEEKEEEEEKEKQSPVTQIKKKTKKSSFIEKKAKSRGVLSKNCNSKNKSGKSSSSSSSKNVKKRKSRGSTSTSSTGDHISTGKSQLPPSDKELDTEIRSDDSKQKPKEKLSGKRRRVPTTKAVLGSLETLDAELDKKSTTAKRAKKSTTVATFSISRKRQRKSETKEIDNGNKDVHDIESSKMADTTASSKMKNGHSTTSKKDSSAVSNSTNQKRRSKSNTITTESSNQHGRNNNRRDPITNNAKEKTTDNVTADEAMVADASLSATKVGVSSPSTRKEPPATNNNKERRRSSTPTLKSGPMPLEVDHADRCSKCQRRHARRGCSQAACLHCCTDEKCEGHKEIREKAKLDEAILNGTTDIQIKAAIKRASAILPGTFREKAFQYHSETSVLWSFQDYMAVPKWKEDTIRKSSKRNRRREFGTASPEEISSAPAPRKENRKQRFKRVMDELYQKSQTESKGDSGAK